MGDFETAMRDPIFYRLHKYFDDMFDLYKRTLTPYSDEELLFDDIVLNDINVQQVSDNNKGWGK